MEPTGVNTRVLSLRETLTVTSKGHNAQGQKVNTVGVFGVIQFVALT